MEIPYLFSRWLPADNIKSNQERNDFVPRLPRNSEEIEKVRENILNHALDIIGTEGYDNLTMRSLGERLGFAAKTVYNYYSSKEEIYLRVLTRGFETLNIQAGEAIKGVDDPIERLRILSKVYLDFGINNANYYNIMFNWDVPKFTDYVGTILEPIAREERDEAFAFAKVAEQTVGEILQDEKVSEEEITFQVIKLWSGLHGIVSLYNSHGIHEYASDVIRFMNRIAEDLLADFILKFKSKGDPV